MHAIFDLDGCIADDRWRQPLIDFGAADPWMTYHDECHRDKLINAHLISLTRPLRLIIFTARPERVRTKTERWLREVAGVKPKMIFMRPEGCCDGSPALKKNFLAALLKAGVGPRDIEIAFDDREDVLEVYKAQGIKTVKAEYPSEELTRMPKKVDVALSAAKKLEAMADTFRARNKVYGSNYKMVGKLMRILFPNGVPPELVFEDHFHLFELLLVKISRYAVSNLTHTDSIHDAAVYAAMCEAINDQKKEK